MRFFASSESLKKQNTDINEVINITLQRHNILVPVIDDKLIGLVVRPDILKNNVLISVLTRQVCTNTINIINTEFEGSSK
jgi:hypothetical protein